jgi:NitT/TauT family transport system substrate-binding protein
MKSYGIVESGDAAAQGIGTMTDAKWKVFFDTMVADKLYDKALPYRNAYDLRFIKTVHVK